MSGWLDPVRRALDARAERSADTHGAGTSPDRVAVFCRDDDAGWDDDGLARLLDVCAGHALPIDLAVIPATLTDVRVAFLLARRRAHPARLGLHQHGWAHVNHEPAGRKCEFGPARAPEDARADIARGQAAMAAAFGAASDPIFTPPWNRCTPAVGQVLVETGVTLLSRESGAAPLALTGLTECSPHADWSSRTRGVAMGLHAFGERCAAGLATGDHFGVLFHHAAMDAEARAQAGALLGVLATHPAVCGVSLAGAAEAARAPRAALVSSATGVMS